MSTILRGWLNMAAAMFGLLGIVLIDHLLFLTLRADEATGVHAARGMVLGGDVDNIWLVMACGAGVYATGVAVLRRPEAHGVEGPIPIALGLLSLGPLWLFAFAVSMMRG